MSDAPRELRPGEDFGGYRLSARVWQGNFCDVWRAEGEGGVEVALKIATTDAGRRMLESEAAIAPRIARCAVVQVSAFCEGPLPHIVMRWLGGRNFRNVLDDVKTPDARARVVLKLLRVIDTMASVHASTGLTHGDLKPENVLVDEKGEPRVADFGLAREIRAHRMQAPLAHSLATVAGPLGGTLAYLPPEGVKGDEPSHAGDVYALGVMLHEALLGRRPEKGVGPEDLKRVLPADAVDVLVQALAFDPRDRYQSAVALAEALRPIVPALTETGASRVARAAGQFLLRGAAAFFVGLRYAAVLALLAGYAFLIVAGLVVHPGIWLSALAIVPLHATIRWEGPETPQEVSLRRAGMVVASAQARKRRGAA